MEEKFRSFDEYLGFVSRDLERQRQELIQGIDVNLRVTTQRNLSFEVVSDYLLGAQQQDIHMLPSSEGRPYFYRRVSLSDGVCALDIYLGGSYDDKPKPNAYSIDLLLSSPLLRENPPNLITYQGEGPMNLFDTLKKREEESRQAIKA